MTTRAGDLRRRKSSSTALTASHRTRSPPPPPLLRVGRSAAKPGSSNRGWGGTVGGGGHGRPSSSARTKEQQTRVTWDARAAKQLCRPPHLFGWKKATTGRPLQALSVRIARAANVAVLRTAITPRQVAQPDQNKAHHQKGRSASGPWDPLPPIAGALARCNGGFHQDWRRCASPLLLAAVPALPLTAVPRPRQPALAEGAFGGAVHPSCTNPASTPGPAC